VKKNGKKEEKEKVSRKARSKKAVPFLAFFPISCIINIIFKPNL